MKRARAPVGSSETQRDTAGKLHGLDLLPLVPRGENGSKSVLVNSWVSAAPERRCYEVPSAWRAPPGEPKLQWGGGSRAEPLRDGDQGAGGSNKGIQDSGWKNSGWAPEAWRAVGRALSPEEEFRFGALPSEKAACKDSLGFISTPSFFIWGNQLGTGSDLLQITPGVWATRAATSHPLANSPIRESTSFFLNHFFFAFSLWFEKRMSSVRASKTWPALGRISAHTYGSQASF